MDTRCFHRPVRSGSSVTVVTVSVVTLPSDRQSSFSFELLRIIRHFVSCVTRSGASLVWVGQSLINDIIIKADAVY